MLRDERTGFFVLQIGYVNVPTSPGGIRCPWRQYRPLSTRTQIHPWWIRYRRWGTPRLKTGRLAAPNLKILKSVLQHTFEVKSAKSSKLSKLPNAAAGGGPP